jgi:hypothetical protein
MDMNLGILGHEIEDFEDQTLIPGLAITMIGTFAGPNDSQFGPVTFAPPRQAIQPPWDGSSMLYNLPPVDGHRSRTIFSFSRVVRSFGIGLFSFEASHDVHLEVNGVKVVDSIASMPGYGSNNGRNGYLRIHAGTGDSIQTVEFEQTVATAATGISEIQLDHLAVSDVPEPATYALALAALCIVTGGRRSIAARW